MTVDELHGILTMYEMITGLNETSKKEATFKVSSKNQSENLDDEEALFVSKLNKVVTEKTSYGLGYHNRQSNHRNQSLPNMQEK